MSENDPRPPAAPPAGVSDPDYYVSWTPPPIPPGQGRRVARIIIGALAGLLLLIGAVGLLRSNLIQLPGGRGTVVGSVVDAAGRPAPATVFLIGSADEVPAAADGRFELREVPAGRQSIFVALGGIAWEVPVEVVAGQTVDVGPVRVEVTAAPTP